METKMKEKKIRWNISKMMACVYDTLSESKLVIKPTKTYKDALGRLSALYKLPEKQIWILCLSCEYFFEEEEPLRIKSLAELLRVPAMSIINWKSDIEDLINKGFLEWKRIDSDFQPTDLFCNSICNNTEFTSGAIREVDEVDFLAYIADRYKKRGFDAISAIALQMELSKYEYNNRNMAMVKRVSAVVEYDINRLFLYYVANDVILNVDTNLNTAMLNLYDGNVRYRIVAKLMDESHELFQKGLMEFTSKSNLVESCISLTDKGRMLVLGDKAFLFEDAINEEYLIKADSIKTKKLFYSEENTKEIERLRDVFQEKTLNRIQQRLKEEALPVGLAVLLYGAPGTGKTETVFQLAKETGRSVIHVDISELKSVWYGESEKRIRLLFVSYKRVCEICEKKGELFPILLFNEADAIIAQRQRTSRGKVNQTENSIQNIILEELESLTGIFIATTNLVSNMDDAFERRFLFKIRFENPSPEAKISIWRDKLSWLEEESAEEFAHDYDFSGGQIDNVVRKILMNEIITGKRPEITEIRAMCRSEKIEEQENTRRMGFSA
ncbi:MAG: ATP-binding protein [Treponemataceae bacterium]|nr:ATP-binding protein [Treponemataceae bacterium]